LTHLRGGWRLRQRSQVLPECQWTQVPMHGITTEDTEAMTYRVRVAFKMNLGQRHDVSSGYVL
jgi:hypothetical protein